MLFIIGNELHFILHQLARDGWHRGSLLYRDYEICLHTELFQINGDKIWSSIKFYVDFSDSRQLRP